MVVRLLTDAGRDDLVEAAQLLVSEVVTNALMHSGTSIDLSMAVADDDGVLVEVGDGSPHFPARRNYAPTASTGRGLALVEQTADAWGVVPGIRGKTVWFQLTSPEQFHQTAAVRRTGNVRGEEAPAVETVTVELLNVPLLLHAAWQQHVEAVLREYLLASLEVESDENALIVHAAATDALAVLAEHIPRPEIRGNPDEVMSAAVDREISTPRLSMPVPRSSVPHFSVLDTALEAAVTMGERGGLLVPPVQPELRGLRRWLCSEVVHQARGVRPTPWPPAGEPPMPPRPRLDWDARQVTDATDSRIAADDTGRVVAVSDALLDLLGHRRQELVGERLVGIIPRRYRQAHLAGFTLHLLSGRGPLLDRPVTVPALHRDGHEITVELSVSAHRVADGHSVFVAALRERDGTQS